LSLKSPSDVRVKAGGLKLLREHQLIFMSKCEDEEMVMSGVIYAAVKQ
jgi:hypothetical protein